MPYQPGDIIGNYMIHELLGAGGNGEVYRAEDRTLHRQAAVKVLHVPLTTGQLKKFMQEAQHLAALKHAHILTVYEYFSLQNSVPVLVTEYASGGSLRDVFDQNPGPQQLANALSWIMQIGEALQYAHNQKIVHRDVKPDNILINGQRYLLGDFGLAVVLHATVSRTSIQSQEGTPLYRPDEQSRHKAVFQSDQYAFACMIWEWLAGEPPFTGDQLMLLLDHRSTTPDRTKLTRLSIPENVIQALMRALSKNPRDRFPRIEEFVAAVTVATNMPSVLHTTQVLPIRPAYTEVLMLICQNCNTQNQPYELFCGGCGASLQGAIQLPTTTATPASSISAEVVSDDLDKIILVINYSIQSQKPREQYFFEWIWMWSKTHIHVTDQLKSELVKAFKNAGWDAFRYSGVDRGGTAETPGLVLNRPTPVDEEIK